MQVEIWSDMMCPFCYIGKRKFEKALRRFPHAEEVEITWKSFQLDPGLPSLPGKNLNAYLAERKGWTLEQARQAHDRVTRTAKEVGLEYDFDKAVVANSFDAHRLVQAAKVRNLGDAMEERLFRAYFTEGRNIADPATLTQLGVEAGLDEAGVRQALTSDEFAQAVRNDIREARQLGVTGVPFFVLDRKYAVSGAQDSAVFLQALQQAHEESGATP
jgi:predicted DsbA family dithiol-disulfide isomerase